MLMTFWYCHPLLVTLNIFCMHVRASLHGWTWLLISANLAVIRVGPRCDKSCANISSKTGSNIPWVTEMRYLGVYFVQSRYLKCSLTVAKRGFYRAANSIFGKIGRCASEEVILQLISSKCIPILLYGLEVLPMQKYQLNSLDFVINRFLWSYLKPATFVSYNYAKNCSILNCQVFSLLVVENYF